MLFATLLVLAATAYFFQLGRAGFDDAEAYSAYIASRKTVAAVFDASLQLDPGKGGGLYVFILHWYAAIFGTGEPALRAFSAAFALASLILVYALAADLFGSEVALIAAALWAFNPIALIVARWARMYSMFIALTLASLLAMRKVQRRRTTLRVATFGALGAAMLYTHLAGALMLGAEAAILARDRWRGRAILPRMRRAGSNVDDVHANRARRARAGAHLSLGSSFRLDGECVSDAFCDQDFSRADYRDDQPGARVWSSDAIRSCCDAV